MSCPFSPSREEREPIVRFYGASPVAAFELPTPTDPATTAANASGLLTPQQQAQLRAALTPVRAARSLRVIQIVFALLFVVPFLACAGFFVQGTLPDIVRAVAPGGVSDLPSILANWRFAAPLLLFPLFFVVFLLLTLNSLAVQPLRAWARRRRIGREVELGRVAQAEGEVNLRRSGYVARAGDRTLRSPTGERAVLLAPGAYRFYFLPASGVLVSAEPRPGLLAGLTGIGPDGAPRTPQAAVVSALGRALHFSDDDLALNRQGRMSEAQRRRLVGWSISLLVVALALCLVVPAILIVSIQSLQAGCPVAICLVIGGVVLLIVRSSLRDLRAGSVMVVRGPVQRIAASDGEGGRTYYFTIAGMRFSVSRAAYDALIPNLPYAVYYRPRGRALLSIELLESTPDAR